MADTEEKKVQNTEKKEEKQVKPAETKTPEKKAPETKEVKKEDSKPEKKEKKFFGGKNFAKNSENNEKKPFDRKGGFKGHGKFAGKKKRTDRKRKEQDDEFSSEVITIRRVTRVVKGGKRMRFSATVVVGDKNGRVGCGVKKGTDFQSAVQKATNDAKKNLIKIELNENGSVPFPSRIKYKSAEIYLKPADSGTGLISGGYLRPVLELAGFQNVYSKIIGTRNKVIGVQAAVKALENYTKETK